LDGKSYPFALLNALLLVRSGSAQGGVERQVVSFTVRGAGLDVTPAFSVGMGV
jgi:hypothetical protein